MLQVQESSEQLDDDVITANHVVWVIIHNCVVIKYIFFF